MRAVTANLVGALAAVRARDAQDLAAALRELGRGSGSATRLDPAQVGLVVGLLLGELLERTHPDGIDSDDAELIVERCLREARSWYPDLDEDQLLRALAGALRIDTYAGPDAVTVGDRTALLAHGLLLVSDLSSAGGQPFEPVLVEVLDGLRRDGAVEHP